MISIAITGPECSGKTTLAKELSSYLKCKWVEEYSRIYLDHLHRAYVEQDLVEIAKGQLKLYHEQARFNPEIIVSDTDLTVIQIWSEVKYGRISDELKLVLESASAHDYYLLCYPDLAWEADPLRESENNRHELFELYEKTIKEKSHNYSVIKGIGKSRYDLAISIIKEKFGK